MILKKLFTENSKNPEKSFLSRKRHAGGEKKSTEIPVPATEKNLFAGGEKENRKTESWGVIQQPRIPFKTWFFRVPTRKKVPRKSRLKEIGAGS